MTSLSIGRDTISVPRNYPPGQSAAAAHVRAPSYTRQEGNHR
jgi:hypothetical protein